MQPAAKTRPDDTRVNTEKSHFRIHDMCVESKVALFTKSHEVSGSRTRGSLTPPIEILILSVHKPDYDTAVCTHTAV